MADNEFEYKAVGVRYTRSESITFQGKQNWIAYKKKGYQIKDWGGGSGDWIAYKKTKIELEVDDGNWVDVTSLVRDYYQRQKITKSLIDKFVQDLASNNVNYEILLKAQGNLEKKKQDDERNKIAAEKAKKDALNYESTKKALEKLVLNIENVLSQVSAGTKEELGQLIVEIKGSEVTADNYSNYHRLAVSLIVKERESRR
ncbi:MAG: hypothetical protein H9W83_11075 [Leuconostoc sp.]|nr:hypothetical protein [Leuconostoc sp.]